MAEKPTKIAVSIDEACEISSFGRTRVFGAISEGLLPAKKFGRRTVVLVSDLEKFLASLPNVIEPDIRPTARDDYPAGETEAADRWPPQTRPPKLAAPAIGRKIVRARTSLPAIAKPQITRTETA